MRKYIIYPEKNKTSTPYGRITPRQTRNQRNEKGMQGNWATATTLPLYNQSESIRHIVSFKFLEV